MITDEYFQRVTQLLVMGLKQHEESVTRQGKAYKAWLRCNSKAPISSAIGPVWASPVRFGHDPGWAGPNSNADHSCSAWTVGLTHSMAGWYRPESIRVCVYLLLKSNIFRYRMSVWSNGMMLTLGARCREFNSRKRKKFFIFHFSYVCIYY